MNPAPPAKRKTLRWIVIILSIVAALFVSAWLVGLTYGDDQRHFRGKLETEWINELKYHDDDQVKEWRGYGEEGVQVLIRGLERAYRPGERAYRNFYRKMPWIVSRWLPWPKQDVDRAKRMTILALLSNLGSDAKSAVPVVSRMLNDDDGGVLQLAISFFTSSEDEKCTLNQLPPAQKKRLLPLFIRAMQNKTFAGARNNAAIALRFYPEQKEIVAPVLVKALQDTEPAVRLLAADALWHVDPVAAEKADAVSVMIALTKLPDDQLASRAISKLPQFKGHADLAVPAIVECVGSTNNLVACQAIWAFEWKTDEYRAYANTIIPTLEKAATLTNNVGRYARTALKKWQSSNAVTNN